MTEAARVLEIAHDVVADLRRQGAGLDGTDASLWFVQGVLTSMSTQPKPGDDMVVLGLAVYVAEVLAATTDGVEVIVDLDGKRVDEIRAVGPDRRTQNVLTWLWSCREDPDADNVVFKYLCALRDFGARDRAAVLSDQLRQYAEVRKAD